MRKENDYFVVLFNSRNKDNTNVKNFKERRKMFLTTYDKDDENLIKKFNSFVRDGVPGEFCRMYYSVNSRDQKKIHTQLMHYLIDNPDLNFASIESILVGIAAKKNCAKSKRWMFDFDIDDETKLAEFCEDIKTFGGEGIEVTPYKTPHGYAVITSRGFDVRPLYNKWNSSLTECKPDDLLCVRWTNN